MSDFQEILSFVARFLRNNWLFYSKFWNYLKNKATLIKRYFKFVNFNCLHSTTHQLYLKLTKQSTLPPFTFQIFFVQKNKHLATFSAKNISFFHLIKIFLPFFIFFHHFVRFIYDMIATALSLHAHELLSLSYFSSFLATVLHRTKREKTNGKA